jgi:hypothetical protein
MRSILQNGRQNYCINPSALLEPVGVTRTIHIHQRTRFNRPLPQAVLTLPWPVVPDPFFEEVKWNVLGLPARAS